MVVRHNPLANRKKNSELVGTEGLYKKHQEMTAFQAEYATALTNADQHLQEVKVFVDRLLKMALQFEEAGSTVKRQFSMQVQHDALQAEIKLGLQAKAEVQAKSGISEERNVTICQAFVDDIIVYLARGGIRLNPLNVMKVRKSRWS